MTGTPESVQRPRARASILLLPLGVTLLAGLVFFWPRLVAGRDLSPSEAEARIEAVLGASAGPGVAAERSRHAVLAIEQIARRSRAGDAAFLALRTRLPALARAESTLVRRAAAQGMGEAAPHEHFVPALVPLLEDDDLIVRRLAAEALAALENPSGREILLQSLEPRVVRVEHAGRVIAGVELGMRVQRQGQLAFVQTTDAGRRPVLAPITGEVAAIRASGSEVAPGDELATLLPDRDQVWRALRGLYLVGRAEDVARIRAALDARQGLGRDVLRQKNETIELIEERARRGIGTGQVR